MPGIRRPPPGKINGEVTRQKNAIKKAVHDRINVLKVYDGVDKKKLSELTNVSETTIAYDMARDMRCSVDALVRFAAATGGEVSIVWHNGD